MKSWHHHYKEAERLLDSLSYPHHTDYGDRKDRLMQAQVHATLASIKHEAYPEPVEKLMSSSD